MGQRLYCVSMLLDKPTLLLVESDPLSLSLYDRELNPDYSIITCTTERDAHQILASQKIGLIILEPGSGNDWAWDFFTQIKHDEQTANIPVIFCSVVDERKRGLEQGAAAYLVKPVYASILRQHIQTLLAHLKNQTDGGEHLTS